MEHMTSTEVHTTTTTKEVTDAAGRTFVFTTTTCWVTNGDKSSNVGETVDFDMKED